jgi:type IV secretory pathway VirB10-like protein
MPRPEKAQARPKAVLPCAKNFARGFCLFGTLAVGLGVAWLLHAPAASPSARAPLRSQAIGAVRATRPIVFTQRAEIQPVQEAAKPLPVLLRRPGETALSWAWRMTPAQAAAAAKTLGDAGDADTRLALVGRWAEAAGEQAAAARWAARTPDLAAREAALAAVLTEWASRDAASAGKFLTALPADDASWDAARAAYALARGWAEPEQTPHWVALIINVPTRQRVTLALVEAGEE